MAPKRPASPSATRRSKRQAGTDASPVDTALGPDAIAAQRVGHRLKFTVPKSTSPPASTDQASTGKNDGVRESSNEESDDVMEADNEVEGVEGVESFNEESDEESSDDEDGDVQEPSEDEDPPLAAPVVVAGAAGAAAAAAAPSEAEDPPLAAPVPPPAAPLVANVVLTRRAAPPLAAPVDLAAAAAPPAAAAAAHADDAAPVDLAAAAAPPAPRPPLIPPGAVNAGDARCGPFGTTLEQLYEWCCDNIGTDRFQRTNGRISKTHTIASLAEEYVAVVGNRDHRFFSFFCKVWPNYFEEDGSRTDGQNVHFRTFEEENNLVPTVQKFYQEVLSNRANLLPSTKKNALRRNFGVYYVIRVLSWQGGRYKPPMSAARNRAGADKTPWPAVFQQLAEFLLEDTIGYFPKEAQDVYERGSGQAFVRMWQTGLDADQKAKLRPYFEAMGITWLDNTR
jgi:hypothetical protein